MFMIVYCQVDAGYIITGTPVVIMPGGDTALAKQVTTAEELPLDYCVAGEQCILVLGGTDQTKVTEIGDNFILF